MATYNALDLQGGMSLTLHFAKEMVALLQFLTNIQILLAKKHFS